MGGRLHGLPVHNASALGGMMALLAAMGAAIRARPASAAFCAAGMACFAGGAVVPAWAGLFQKRLLLDGLLGLNWIVRRV